MLNKIKFFSIITAVIISVGSLAGCAEKDTGSAADSSASVSESTDTEVPAPESAAPVVREELKRSGEVRDISPAELIAEMKTGWNLGNTLDAYGTKGLVSEVSWGNPKTTQAMIDEVHSRGFDIIRIPVTWTGHFSETPDHTIDSEWMDRVQEVVNYAIDDGMYVILDSHHEEEWRILDNAHIDEVEDTVYTLWVQIAERFKDYDDHLIFEGMNEPRVVGGQNEWNGGTEEGRRCLDRLNQVFIDAVRLTGGNNEKRLLLVTTFASACASETVHDVAIPDDEHIAFSIHAYTPYAFTYSVGESWELFEWDGSHNNEIDYMLSELKAAFLDKGIPVIITEYGAVNKDGNEADVAAWTTYYLESSKALGIPCVWWDNGLYTSGNELFGIFNRFECSWYTDIVADAIMAVYE